MVVSRERKTTKSKHTQIMVVSCHVMTRPCLLMNRASYNNHNDKDEIRDFGCWFFVKKNTIIIIIRKETFVGYGVHLDHISTERCTDFDHTIVVDFIVSDNIVSFVTGVLDFFTMS